MINLRTHLQEIQYCIDESKYGYLLLIRLLNYDEIIAVYEALDIILPDLVEIINISVKESSINSYKLFTQHHDILLILPEAIRDGTRQLALKIYELTQLYTNIDYTELYIDIKLTSISFGEDIDNNATNLYRKLVANLSYLDSNKYYYEYNELLHNLNLSNIKQYNLQLNKVRAAISRKALKFAYQPIIDHKTSDIAYYECLLRMPGNLDQCITMGDLIPYAEKNGLINIIDNTVFNMVISELAQNHTIHLSINISNIGIVNDDLLDKMILLLTKYQVADRLIIEITETSLNYNYDKTRTFMNRLREFGCRFALDDFGAGFTSFKQLQNLPVDIIKVDGSYVRDIIHNNHSKYFVETLIKIAGELGIKTVAEFVESDEVAIYLAKMNIDFMQGNYFSPPMQTLKRASSAL